MRKIAEKEKHSPYYDDCLNIIKHDDNALEFVKRQTPELCLEAVKQNGLALYHVKEQTEEICLTAVRENDHAL